MQSIRTNRKTGRTALIIISCIILMLLALLIVSFARNEQPRETLAEWRPATRPGDMASHKPSDYTAANECATLTHSNVAIVLGGAGGTAKEGPQHSYYSRGWSIGDQWWQVSEISTQGYEDIGLSFTTRGSNTGPKYFTLEYRKNSEEWLPLTDSGNSPITYAVDADNKFHQHGPYVLPAVINDSDRLDIRFLNADTESIAGGPVKSSGTNYITDVIITGARMEAK